MRFGESGNQTQIHVDPGPGALVRALSHVPPCNPRELDAIVLSHKHLDHSADVNAVIAEPRQIARRRCRETGWKKWL
jgi:phosphoribosyl 1,2-cyclic phosphodiesterase